MIAIRKRLGALAKSERGATAIEYGLLCALITVAALGGMQALGGGVGGKWGDLAATVAMYMG